KRRTDALGIRTLLVMQHGAGVILTYEAPRQPALRVEACARLMGIQVVDEFATLKAIATADRAALASYYVMHGDIYGHMSARGNERVAGLAAEALGEPPAAGSADAYAADTVQPGDGANLLPAPQDADRISAGAAFASFTPISAGTATAGVYRL